MDYTVKSFDITKDYTQFSSYVLGIDVGGTNTNCAIAGIQNSELNLLFSLNFKSKEINSLTSVINEAIHYVKNKYGVEVDTTCIGAAGVVSPSGNSAQLTNVDWNIDTLELLDTTPLQSIYLINDFQAIGYGVNLLNQNNPHDILEVKPRLDTNTSFNPNKVILGAGTGLGKSILVYDRYFDAYIPIPSEGGHADIPVYDAFEFELIQFVKDFRKISESLPYEEVLSGRGLESIYLFLRSLKKYADTEWTNEIDRSQDRAPLISEYKNMDETCRETFRLFTRFYARCAKNLVLDTMAYGGLYIAGGIAIKNKKIFSSKDFSNEFEHGYRRSDFLKKIPIYLVTNYDVSLYGACFAAMYYLKK